MGNELNDIKIWMMKARDVRDFLDILRKTLLMSNALEVMRIARIMGDTFTKYQRRSEGRKEGRKQGRKEGLPALP